MLAICDIPEYVITSNESVIFNCDEGDWFERLSNGLFHYDWYKLSSKTRATFNKTMDYRIESEMEFLGYRRGPNREWIPPDNFRMTSWGMMLDNQNYFMSEE